MKYSKQQRIESLLTTIDRLGIVKISHLQKIHDLKSYRNACRVIKQLDPYTFVTYHEKNKVFYLNKQGRELIGSDKEVKKTSMLDHMLYCNEAYIRLNCPIDWKREVAYVIDQKTPSSLDIKINGPMKAVAERRIVADASFQRNGYTYLVEIDNTRKMIDNRKKMETYGELFRLRKDVVMKLLIFTTTPDRKKSFEKLIQEHKIRGEVFVYEEMH